MITTTTLPTTEITTNMVEMKEDKIVVQISTEMTHSKQETSQHQPQCEQWASNNNRHSHNCYKDVVAGVPLITVTVQMQKKMCTKLHI